MLINADMVATEMFVKRTAYTGWLISIPLYIPNNANVRKIKFEMSGNMMKRVK
jgi:hypothetical protein